jgi:hypothetical protein
MKQQSMKQRIAREWLIFLACAVIGFTLEYFTVYYPETRIERMHYIRVASAPSPDSFKEAPEYSRKSPGELIGDLLSGHGAQWFAVLVPYFGLSLVRSVVWSARTTMGR